MTDHAQHSNDAAEAEAFAQFNRDRHASVSRMTDAKALKIDADSWMFEQLIKAELRSDLRDMAHEIARKTTCPMLPLMQAH